jgi:RimJ/RimL family protein N-acetyltransferase
MIVLETDRLNLRHLTEKDAEFVLELLNEPSFLRGIGDRGVRTVEQARRYVLDVPVASYEEHGFGLYLVELKEPREPLGMCGLVNREGLEGIDVGFAFLPAFWSQGYAFESASAVMSYARDTLGLQRVVAIASPDNERSFKLLEKLGLEFDSMTRLSEDEPELSLYSIDF